MKVKCIKNKTENSTHNLILGKTYYVTDIEYDDYRIEGEEIYHRFCGPVLYPKESFEIIDDFIDPLWIKEFDSDESLIYHGPKIFLRYFWEDFHDEDEAGKKEILNKYKAHIYGF